MVLAKALAAPKPKSETVKKVAWVYAAILVVMALGQLFAFEKFIPLLQEYHLVGGNGTATLAAALIAILEVFSLPFLLRMPLSPLMRWCSLVCSVLVPIAWLGLSIVAFIHGGLDNGGIVGTKVHVSATLQLLLSVILGALAAWSVWGLMPSRKN